MHVVGQFRTQGQLHDHALSLLDSLSGERFFGPSKSRPLVSIAHSLGGGGEGLGCKKALLISNTPNPDNPCHRYICDSARGIIFMGTPHHGSWIADLAQIPAKVLGTFSLANTDLLQVLKSQDQYADALQVEFLGLVRTIQEKRRNFRVSCGLEQLNMPGVGKPIVPRESAVS